MIVNISCNFTVNMNSFLFLTIFCLLFKNGLVEEVLESNSQEQYVIEGKVFPPDSFAFGPIGNWQLNTRILANGGEYKGFLREDGSFTISNVPSGSYVVEAINADFAYEPVRVEINAKGKFRSRKVNHIQTSQIVHTPYPLRMKPINRMQYFQIREQWRITDFLLSPMVLMMVLPLVLVMILPKMINDPESKKEMEQLKQSMKYDMPDVSEVITCLFSGGDKTKTKSVKAAKKKQ